MHLIRSPQRLAAGVVLLGVCAFVLWGVSGLSQGTVRVMGPAMFPRYLALLLGIFGVVLVVLSVRVRGEPLPKWQLRGPVLVPLAVVLFSMTIRPFGLLVAGILTLVVSGFATPEAKPREIIIFAVAMTVASILLFRFGLEMAVPVLAIPGTSIAF